MVTRVKTEKYSAVCRPAALLLGSMLEMKDLGLGSLNRVSHFNKNLRRFVLTLNILKHSLRLYQSATFFSVKGRK